MPCKTMQALVLTPETREATVRNLPLPTPAPGEVLIRVHAIALNPVDALYVANPMAQQERVVGTDFAGVIVSASRDLDGSDDVRTHTGTRVAGFLQGGGYCFVVCSCVSFGFTECFVIVLRDDGSALEGLLKQ